MSKLKGTSLVGMSLTRERVENDFYATPRNATEAIQHRSEVRFVKGRLKFGNSKQAAPFPSMVVIFRGAGM